MANEELYRLPFDENVLPLPRFSLLPESQHHKKLLEKTISLYTNPDYVTPERLEQLENFFENFLASQRTIYLASQRALRD